MSRVLFVTWDGAGNLVPTLGLAQRLARRGHDVRVLGHRSIDARCGRGGWRFRELRQTPDFNSAAVRPGPEDMSIVARQLWFNPSVAHDTREELQRESADVIVADCLLAGALCAGEAAETPTVALFHGAYGLFRRGPLHDRLAAMRPLLDDLRAGIGLPPVEGLAAVHDACALSLVATPREFEPDMPIASNVVFAGPFLDAPPLLAGVDDPEIDSDGRPLVLVGFSTSHQGQLPLLQRIVDALGTLPVNAVVTTGPAIDPAAIEPRGDVRIVRFARHDRLLPRASLVITHAGLGTVMSTLAHGVTLLCVPLGRDQFFNAARVEALGAGRALDANADGATIAAAVTAALNDETARAGARRAAAAIARCGNAQAAVPAIENLAARFACYH
jgi:UDP:flavonoid glycosyltransferase YjiC (YdhE family)